MNVKNMMLLVAAILVAFSATAQSKKSKWSYDQNGTDQLIFSWNPTVGNTPRFSSFYNANFNGVYKFNNKAAFLIGGAIKNIGTTTRYTLTGTEYVSRTRYYTVGVPVSLRFGNLRKSQWFGVEGGVDLPFHRKSKTWVAGDKRDTKVKNSDWFPNNTTVAVPFVGAGFCYKKIGIKYVRYLADFNDPSLSNGRMQYISVFINSGGKGSGAGKSMRKKINLKSKNNTL
ncbi:MAG: hypothetical protein RL660_666 [Bacteroidota bacterium]|jgi:hypothetical protein